MDSAFLSPDPTTVDYRLHRKDGELRWFQSRGRAIQDNTQGSVRLMGITLDISERKKVELEAEELRRELAHVTRTSMMGELAASICHELNQPLAAILSNAQAARRFLAETPPDPDEIRAIVEDIIRDDKRAAEVIQRLRSLFMKNNYVPAQMLSVHEVVDEVVELLNPELSARGVTLKVLTREEKPLIRFVRIDLQQILLNMIVNAMDAMEETPRHVHISTEILKDVVRLSLTDNGRGIAREILPEIFRPYFSTKSKGMGMGLAVAQSMMEQHQGRIWAENNPGGRGAVFHLDFPAVGKNIREDAT
jgi:C4-dicarboxylate-specific signal transduction histidine kinase